MIELFLAASIAAQFQLNASGGGLGDVGNAAPEPGFNTRHVASQWSANIADGSAELTIDDKTYVFDQLGLYSSPQIIPFAEWTELVSATDTLNVVGTPYNTEFVDAFGAIGGLDFRALNGSTFGVVFKLNQPFGDIFSATGYIGKQANVLVDLPTNYMIAAYDRDEFGDLGAPAIVNPASAVLADEIAVGYMDGSSFVESHRYKEPWAKDATGTLIYGTYGWEDGLITAIWPAEMVQQAVEFDLQTTVVAPDASYLDGRYYSNFGANNGDTESQNRSGWFGSGRYDFSVFSFDVASKIDSSLYQIDSVQVDIPVQSKYTGGGSSLEFDIATFDSIIEVTSTNFEDLPTMTTLVNQAFNLSDVTASATFTLISTDMTAVKDQFQEWLDGTTDYRTCIVIIPDNLSPTDQRYFDWTSDNGSAPFPNIIINYSLIAQYIPTRAQQDADSFYVWYDVEGAVSPATATLQYLQYSTDVTFAATRTVGTQVVASASLPALAQSAPIVAYIQSSTGVMSVLDVANAGGGGGGSSYDDTALIASLDIARAGIEDGTETQATILAELASAHARIEDGTQASNTGVLSIQADIAAFRAVANADAAATTQTILDASAGLDQAIAVASSNIDWSTVERTERHVISFSYVTEVNMLAPAVWSYDALEELDRTDVNWLAGADIHGGTIGDVVAQVRGGLIYDPTNEIYDWNFAAHLIDNNDAILQRANARVPLVTSTLFPIFYGTLNAATEAIEANFPSTFDWSKVSGSGLRL